MLNITASYTDLYQLTMAQVYYKTRPEGTAVFDYYFRNNPFGGGYTVFAGLENILELLRGLKFSDADIAYLESLGFKGDFLGYLKKFRFNGSVFSVSEGDVVFPNCPIIQIEGSIIEAQIVETVLLNILNFQTLVASKAARIRYSAGDSILLDMGLRRAHATGGYFAARAAAIGGFNSTSNVKAAEDFNIPSSGTMAHAFIQSYDDELQAFRDFAQFRPKHCVLLVDTYSTLKSGIPNAIKVAKEMEQRGNRLFGIRLDSGDLAYLAKKARNLLDNAGLEYVKIAVSNQLDEYVIKSLREQGAPIDIFGVGTNLVTGKPDAALDGVYKLSEYNDEPRIKLSENIIKVSLPSKKQVFRIFEKNGSFYGADAVGLASERTIGQMLHPFNSNKHLDISGFKQEPLLQKVMEKGEMLIPKRNVSEIAEYTKNRLALLPQEYKRFTNPHIYKMGLSAKLKTVRDQLIAKYSV